jgi:chemotaxis methyl-accepting protein methylase
MPGSDHPERPGRARRSARPAGEPLPAPAARPGALDIGRGELTPRAAAEFRDLKKRIQAKAGLCCEGYKERVLRRRIAVRMRAKGVQTFAAYAELLEQDDSEYQHLVDTVTINVSKFFRNASTWIQLRDRVIPELFAWDAPQINVWSAGSAAGEESYSLAILLLQHAAQHGGNLDKFRVTATDIDEGAIADARIAEYGPFAFTEMSAATRNRWFEGPDHNRLKEEVKRLVEFRKLDLITEPFPSGLHLLLCRNVLIYFERNVQLELFDKFRDALVPGGYLQLGKVETLFGSRPGMFETVSARERLFRKHDAAT